MFTKTAAWYDAIYGSKDYAREAQHVARLIQGYKTSDGNALLDVACGTGAHLTHLSETYSAEGLDADEELLAIAQKRLPQLKFHQGDMCDFDLGRRFDVVTCLFSSIGYARTPARMAAAIGCMARHLRPGGVLILEPWLRPAQFIAGYLALETVDRPEMKIARMQRSTLEDGLSVLNFSYLVGQSDKVDYFTERHELGLFSHEEIQSALDACGFISVHDPQGLTGRGLYVATMPA